MTDNESILRIGINKYVVKYIDSLDDIEGKIVVDIPAGDGRASYLFNKKGAIVKALDMYPEFMKAENIEATYADMTEPLPLETESVDYLICQEGIEHVSNHLALLREFNRVLKKGGKLILTTPSMSHLRARLSYFLFESDFWRRMPPTELDNIWFSERESDKLYFGHLFLLGVHHLETLTNLSGFKVCERLKTDMGSSSLILGAIFYPLMLVTSLVTYNLYRKKNDHIPKEVRKRILWKHVKLNLSWKTLFCKHIFWVLEKEYSHDEKMQMLKPMSLQVVNQKIT